MSNRPKPQAVVVRGWENICAVMGLKCKRVARRELQALGLLRYDGLRPYLIPEEYKDQKKARPSVEPQKAKKRKGWLLA